MSVFRTLTWTELKLLAREPLVFIFAFAFPVVLVMVLGGVFGTEPDPDFLGVRPSEYYIASYLGVTVAAIGLIAVPVHLSSYRERGILRRFRASGVQPGIVLGAQAAVGSLMAVLGGVLILVIGGLAYGVGTPDDVVPLVVGFVASTAGFLAIGFLLGALAPSARAAQALGMLLFFPMWLLAGGGPPREVMTDTMRQIGDVLPLSYTTRALQDPWFGAGWDVTALAVLAGITVVAGAGSARLLRSA